MQKSQKRHKLEPWVGKIPRRRRWQPTAVFLPRKSHGQRNLVGYSPLGLQTVWHNWSAEHMYTQDCGIVNVAKVLYIYLCIFFFFGLLTQCWITKNKIYKWKAKSFHIYYNLWLWNVNCLAKFNWINNHACLVLWESQFIVKIQNVF